jgi:hypothetical protein
MSRKGHKNDARQANSLATAEVQSPVSTNPLSFDYYSY